MNKNNIIKTINYMKRNGIKKAVGAVKERLTAHYDADYTYQIPSELELKAQRESDFVYTPVISILVPAYETDETFLRELLDSVTGQTYSHWELIIADASTTDQVERVLREYQKDLEQSLQQGKILYRKLSGNRGISDNTNEALAYATGEYIGLLDHDDLLTADALYYMVKAMNEHLCEGQKEEQKEEQNEEQNEEQKGIRNRKTGQYSTIEMLYSDEDKCDETSSYFYEPNLKYDFNLDLLLSNNYICHFLLLKKELMQKLQFRKEYDGAQDYDLILRAVEAISASMHADQVGQELIPGKRAGRYETICHIPRVLYHWRCHSASTAANPASKLYAYEAGKRAVADFLQVMHIQGSVEDTEHVGFYRVEYEPDILTARPEIAAVGGSLYNMEDKNIGGMEIEGKCPFYGMPSYYAGPRNLASVMQQCDYLDARVMLVQPRYHALYEEITGVSYEPGLFARDRAFCNQLDEGIWRQRSRRLCEALQENGEILVWDPGMKVYR